MNKHEAEAIVETVRAAWSWDMEPETFDIWVRAIADLVNAEAAEFGVIELYKSQARRPTVADVVEAYHAQMRRWPEPEPVLVLTAERGLPAVPELAWSPEGARWAVGLAKGRVINGVLYEGESLVATLREEDVVRCEQQAHESYLSLGATSAERAKAVMDKMHGVVDRAEASVGGNSNTGRVCTKHNRWVGYFQTNDPCYGHVFAELVPDSVDPDRHIPLPACPRCGGQNVGECGHLAEMWAEEVDARTKALLKKRGEARDRRRAEVKA